MQRDVKLLIIIIIFDTIVTEHGRPDQQPYMVRFGSRQKDWPIPVHHRD